MTKSNFILELKDMSVFYANNCILSDINLKVNKNEIVCIIGEEGVGKSTLVKAITNQIPFQGLVKVYGRDISQLQTNELVSNSIDFISQGGNILSNFSVIEHLELAMRDKIQRDKEHLLSEIFDFFPKLSILKDQLGGRLSGGERMMLSLACIWATEAKFIILDEPTSGLAEKVCAEVRNILLRLSKKGVTILMVEHNYDFAIETANSIAILSSSSKNISPKFYKEHFSKPDFITKNLYGI